MFVVSPCQGAPVGLGLLRVLLIRCSEGIYLQDGHVRAARSRHSAVFALHEVVVCQEGLGRVSAWGLFGVATLELAVSSLSFGP